MRKLSIDFNRAVEMYESGMFPGQIAVEFGCSKALIYKVFKQHKYIMRDRRIPLNESEVVKLYGAGTSENQLAKQFNVSRNVIRRVLTENNAHIRNQSESESVKWANMTNEQRINQVKRAHDTVRNLPKSFFADMAVKQAKTKEATLSKVGALEAEFIEALGHEFEVVTPQKAVGPYNIDIAIGNTAIEVHINTSHPHSHPYYTKRIVKLLKAGYNVIYIKIGSQAFVHRAAKQICALINATQWDKSNIRQYWMIRGTGELVTVGRLNGDQLTCVNASD